MSKAKRAPTAPPPTATVGRKRDPALDGHLLDAAIQTIADVGYDNMTMDQVAARAGSAKTTLYRRWASKEELVRDALIWMSRHSVETDTVPDTGTLRGDLLAVQKDYSAEVSERKMRVLSNVGGFLSGNSKSRDEVHDGIFGPMTELNKKLMERAMKRGEISSHADIDLAAQTIVATITYRTTIQLKSFDKTQYAKLLDSIILPALKNAPKK